MPSLRRKIKPPARFGMSEADATTASLLQSMHKAREDSVEGPEEFAALPMPANRSGYRKTAQLRPVDSAPVRESYPEQPPAAFPSLTEPRPSNPGRGQTDRNGHLQDEVTNNEANERDEIGPQEWVPKGHIENYVASNSPLNPIYVKNMQIMAGSGDHDKKDLREFDDSDLDEPMDDSDKLNAIVSVPLDGRRTMYEPC